MTGRPVMRNATILHTAYEYSFQPLRYAAPSSDRVRHAYDGETEECPIHRCKRRDIVWRRTIGRDIIVREQCMMKENSVMERREQGTAL